VVHHGRHSVAEQTIFQTGWFVEGLLSQVLVVLVLRSRHGLRAAGAPALPLLVAVVAVLLTGLFLPFTPVAPWVGLAPLPGAYFGWLTLILVAYPVATSQLKRRWVRRAEVFP
jgi:Mg2+-importing ATPase